MIYTPAIYIGIAIGLFGAGYLTGNSLVEPERIETVREVRSVVEVQKEARTQIEYRDRIVVRTVVSRPDGTSETTERIEEHASNTEHQESSTDTVVQVEQVEVRFPERREYLLGLRVHSPSPLKLDTKYTDLLDVNRVELIAGKRAVGDVWLTVGVIPGSRSLSLGVQVEF